MTLFLAVCGFLVLVIILCTLAAFACIFVILVALAHRALAGVLYRGDRDESGIH